MSGFSTRMPGMPLPLLQVALLGGGLVLSAGSSGTAKNKGNVVTITDPECSAKRPPSFDESKARYETSCNYNGGILKIIYAKKKGAGCAKGTYRYRMNLVCDGAEFNLSLLPARPTVTPKLPATAEEKAAMARIMLEEHNRYRTELSLAPLTWSDRLAEFAAEWATHLAKLGGMRMVSSDRTRTGQGENIWIGPWTDGDEAYVAMIRAWGAQKTGNAAQIVARATTHLGCAVALAGDKNNPRLIGVCRYWPPGK